MRTTLSILAGYCIWLGFQSEDVIHFMFAAIFIVASFTI